MLGIDIDLIGIPAFVIDICSNGNFWVVAINRADAQAMNVEIRDVIGRRVEECVPPEVAEHILARYSECVSKRALHEYDERIGSGDEARWWRTTLTPVVEPQSGRVCRIVGVSVEITKRKEHEDILSDAAFSDPLTGLANRRRLERDVAHAITRARLEHRGFGLVVVDLDGFKPINDRHGHRRGDDVLRHIGSLLKLNVDHRETVARLGGDEFALIMETASAGDVRKRAAALGLLLDRNLLIAGESIKIGASVGCAFWTVETTFNELFEVADADMYRQKAIRKMAA